MSWYNDRISKIQSEQNINSPFDSFRMDKNIISTVIIITNMNTTEDFKKIKKMIYTLDGVLDVKRHLNKKMEVVFNSSKIGLQQILTVLDELEYKYLKRTCCNCRKK